MIGQQLSDGITLTASPVAIAQIPILPKEFDIYLDATSAGLGTTKLTRVFSWELKIGNRFGTIWPVNSANASFAAHVEQEISASLKLKMEADTVGMGLLTQMRAGTPQFVRIKATSAQLAGTAIPFSAQFDLAVTPSETPKELADSDGVYALEWNLGLLHDSTWNKAIDVSVINKRTAI
jgi:hypothetical protein